MDYILAIDQGTTSSRAILFNKEGELVKIAQKEFKQIYPSPGWVEHDPIELLNSQLEVTNELIREVGANSIKAIGITNQRETALVWNKETGKPIYNAIVWQDKRTADYCKNLKSQEKEAVFKSKTGLVIDSYFSGTKVNWILENVPNARKNAEASNLLFGTVDTWLIWNMTNHKVHATDLSNASRTLMFNIHELAWDKELLEILNVPRQMLPEVKDSTADYGYYEIDRVKIPITGVAGDQQAALFGQGCFEPGMVKNTYGTGCFMLMNTGETPIQSKSGLLTTIAWGVNGKVTYALEGSVFVAGAAIQWLRDGLELVKNAAETEELAYSVSDAHEIYFVPAFAGLGAPYWDMYAKGAILGIGRDTTKAHIAKAALESMAYQSLDLVRAMEKDAGEKLTRLAVDGGAVVNNYLMQFQSDILFTNVDRPKVTESTALGAAFLAGIQIGFWNYQELNEIRTSEKLFSPRMEEVDRDKLISGWNKAVGRTMNWID